MAIIKCTMCGGNLIPSEDGFGVCDSCGLRQPLVQQTAAPVSSIEKYISTKSSGEKPVDPAIEPMIKRVFLFLEDGKWSSADEYCEKILDLDPEFAPAYLGKLMLEYRVTKPEYLSGLSVDFGKSGSYHKAVRYGDNELKNALAGYYNQAKNNIENRALQEKFTAAAAKMNSAKTQADFTQAAELFKQAGDYGNAAGLAKSCKEKAEEKRCDEIYKSAVKSASKSDADSLGKAIEAFKQIPDYKDSLERADKCEKKLKRSKSTGYVKGIVLAVLLVIFTAMKFTCSAKWASYLDISILQDDMGIKGWLETLGRVISLMAIEVVLTSAVSLVASRCKYKKLRLGELIMLVITVCESFMMSKISCPDVASEKFLTIFVFYLIFSVVCNFTLYILMLFVNRLIKKLTA